MKENIKNTGMIKPRYIGFLLVLLVFFVASCTKDKNSPGYEYMPDMYRSPAVEAYVDYDNPQQMSARKPVEGTIPFTGGMHPEFNFPYAFANTPEGYEEAGKNLVNPLPRNEQNIEEGKEIYTKFCLHCHGKSGKGDGAVVENGGHPPPTAYDGPLKDLSEGKMFHTLTFGKGMMGSHASQLTKEERWKVIQYVQVLQNPGAQDSDKEGEETGEMEKEAENN